jgi:hypothetical protein
MVEVQSPFATVARKIGNSRLEKVLAQLAANIATEVHSAERIPKRSEVRDNLKLLKGEARRFERALSKISLLDISFSAIECLRRCTQDHPRCLRGMRRDFVQHLIKARRAEKAG